ncbi:MarR family winged helix-turn-helix transcriptional regulator [Wenxinia saemankumensis]|uniref:Transcriptional regulator, MarR family n=1 Tax=Wenxinia saemankumensis TaxID=1447782 RepID=A0A1M6GSA3_9RHOB|nr:MarR family transcriptional regulator [Wenxinia saemankumensis]SHJ12811.1 transcriptional regulator, MarR family [Wenxinia saemankumensis]
MTAPDRSVRPPMAASSEQPRQPGPAGPAAPDRQDLIDALRAFLADQPQGAGIAEDFGAIEAAHFQFARMTYRGEVPRRLIAELGLDLDLAQFHVLMSVKRLNLGIGRDGPCEATVGLLAEEMEIDPSRASRIAADLIGRGYLRREAAQDDGRKSVLVLTPRALDELRGFREARWGRLMKGMEGWTAEEVESFARLFPRFVEGLRSA